MDLLRLCAPVLPALALSLCLAACGSPFAGAPPVPDSTFVSALAGLHLAEAHLERQRQQEETGVPPPSPGDTAVVPLPPAVRDSVLARHGMSYGQLRAALAYYVEHPEQYEALYGRVVDTLSAEREKLRFGEGSRRP